MRTDSIFDILGGFILIGLVTTVVTSKNTASQVTAAGNAFANIMNASLGKGSSVAVR